MKVRISKTLAKDTAKITDNKVKKKLVEKIQQLQDAENLSEQPLKKLRGFKDFYRLRIGDYRLGIKKLTEEEILLVRFLHRKKFTNTFLSKLPWSMLKMHYRNTLISRQAHLNDRGSPRKINSRLINHSHNLKLRKLWFFQLSS